MEKYKLMNATDLYGNTRKDGRYPDRIRSTYRISNCNIGTCAIFSYLTDNKGEVKEGYLVTSPIESIKDKDNKKIITTKNTIYTFKEV